MMSERAKNILINNNISTYQQLANMSWLDCLRWDNCGLGTIREFHDLLAAEGLKFRDDDQLQEWLAKLPPRRDNKKLAASLKSFGEAKLPDTYIAKTVTLRDQFAMAALASIIAEGDFYEKIDAANDAYEYADAMLKAREAK